MSYVVLEVGANLLYWLYDTAGSRWADTDLSNVGIIVRPTSQFHVRFTVSRISAASWAAEFQFGCVWQQSTWCWKWVFIAYEWLSHVSMQLMWCQAGSPNDLLRKSLQVAEMRFFTGWMPFPLPNQQCQSSKSTL